MYECMYAYDMHVCVSNQATSWCLLTGNYTKRALFQSSVGRLDDYRVAGWLAS